VKFTSLRVLRTLALQGQIAHNASTRFSIAPQEELPDGQRSAREARAVGGEAVANQKLARVVAGRNGMARLLARGKLTRNEISKYERAVREPSLLVLLRYARIAGVLVDELLDDDLDLPKKLGQSRSGKRR